MQIKNEIKIIIIALSFFTFSYGKDMQDQAIPLSDNSMHIQNGIIAGLSVGALKNNVCDNIITWSGNLSYAYKPNVSGGFNFNFAGGILDSALSIDITKYTFNAKFHKRFKRFDIYIGPVLGVQIGNLNDVSNSNNLFNNIISSESYEEKSLASDDLCTESIGHSGFIAGWDLGVSTLILPYTGLWVNHTSEFINFKKPYFVLSTGLGYEIGHLIPKIHQSMSALFLFIEFSRATDTINLFQDSGDIIFIGGLIFSI